MAKKVYAKYIDEHTIERLRQPIRTEGEDIFTTDPVVLKQYGYLLLVTSQPPEVEDGYIVVESFVEGEWEITQVWTIVPIEEEE